MKIVGIGLNKTGTKTLGACLQYWGGRHQSFSPEAFKLWRQNEIGLLMKWVGEYDSFEDWPWPLVYQEIDKIYKGTKFILTRRKSADIWFESLCRHAERTGPTIFRKHIYGYEMPHFYKHHHIKIYTQHLESTREFFQFRPKDFLEVCWEESDGWEKLSSFLGFEAPNIPFPHENKAPSE